MKSPQTLIERYTNAVRATDRDALLGLYARNARLYDMMLPWEYNGADAWAGKVDDWFAGVGTDTRVEASNVSVTETEGMAVLTMNMLYGHTGSDGEPFSMLNRLTWVAVPESDDWKIIHEHTSVPLKMEDMSPQFHP